MSLEQIHYPTTHSFDRIWSQSGETSGVRSVERRRSDFGGRRNKTGRIKNLDKGEELFPSCFFQTRDLGQTRRRSQYRRFPRSGGDSDQNPDSFIWSFSHADLGPRSVGRRELNGLRWSRSGYIRQIRFLKLDVRIIHAMRCLGAIAARFAADYKPPPSPQNQSEKISSSSSRTNRTLKTDSSVQPSSTAKPRWELSVCNLVCDVSLMLLSRRTEYVKGNAWFYLCDRSATADTQNQPSNSMNPPPLEGLTFDEVCPKGDSWKAGETRINNLSCRSTFILS